MEKQNSKKMRLVVVSGDFPPRISGVGDYAFHVASTAAKMGTDVTVITTKNDCGQSSSQHGTLDVRLVIDLWQFSEAKKILQVLSESDTHTIVNIQYNCPFTYGRRIMINFLPAIIRLFHPKTKIIITVHGFWEQSLLFRLRTVPMLRATHGVIYVDRLNKDLIKKYSGLDENRLKFIPIAGNIPPIPCTEEQRNTWRKELGLAKEDVAVAFFGGIISSKGFDYLVKAIHRIRSENLFPVILLAIGGFLAIESNKAYQSDVSNFIIQARLDDYIHFFENADAALVSKCLHAADLAVYPFLDGVGENSGSMLAALAHGLPTIITSGPANDASFADKFGVFMLPAHDAEILASAIQSIASSHDLRNKMRSKALEVSKHLSWEFITRQTLDYYYSFL